MIEQLTKGEVIAFAMLWLIAIFCVVAIVSLAKQTIMLSYGIRKRFNKRQTIQAQKLLKRIRIGTLLYFTYFTVSALMIKYYPMMVTPVSN